MMKVITLLTIVSLVSCSYLTHKNDPPVKEDSTNSTKVVKSEEEWKDQLSEHQFCVARQKGTERAFTGEYWDNHETGTYICVCCGQALFESTTKFDSGTGWPSFFQPVSKSAIEEKLDKSHGMIRTEVVCSKCDAHLGHVFNDGPKPTGMRYCINSVSLKFLKDTTSSKPE